MHCPNLTIIDTPGFIMKVRAQQLGHSVAGPSAGQQGTEGQSTPCHLSCNARAVSAKRYTYS